MPGERSDRFIRRGVPEPSGLVPKEKPTEPVEPKPYTHGWIEARKLRNGPQS